MGIEMIIGLAAAVIAVIAGAFGFGHARGTSKAEAKADKQRTEENAVAIVAAISGLHCRGWLWSV